MNALHEILDGHADKIFAALFARPAAARREIVCAFGTSPAAHVFEVAEIGGAPAGYTPTGAFVSGLSTHTMIYCALRKIMADIGGAA